MNACREIQKNQKEYILTKQLIRSGTSTGALIREAEYGESRADFIHKMGIAQKECNESLYWIELLCKGGYMNEDEAAALSDLGVEVLKILTSIINTAKANRSK